MGSVLAILVAALSPTCYIPPVTAPIVEPYDAPACAYCPGHRGVEYGTLPGAAVRAVAPGVVTFAGVVVGTRYVVVLHPDGISATYGNLASARPAAGDQVSVGEIVGTSGGRLYFGLRRGDTYLDPAGYLGVVRHRPRLVPSSAASGRPAAPRPASCPALSSGRASGPGFRG